MIKVDREQAEEELGRLIEAAAAGQEVVITTADGAAVRLVPFADQHAEREQPAEERPNTADHALDRYIGTWSAEEEAELLDAI